MKIEEFAHATPPFVLEEFFAGETHASGVVLDRARNFQRQFTVKTSGTWRSSELRLELTETYSFDDGETDRLEWSISRLSNGSYEFQEPTLVKPGAAEQAGNALHLRYKRRVPRKDGPATLVFDDWFWLQSDGSLVASATLGRFNLVYASMALVYRPGLDHLDRISRGGGFPHRVEAETASIGQLNVARGAQR